MKLRHFINKLQSYNESYMEKEIVVVCENGLFAPPEIKFILNNKYDVLNLDVSNIELIIIKGE